MEPYKRQDIYTYKPKQWNLYKDIEGNNFELLIKTILEKNECFNIIGPAGCGKGFLIKQLQQEIIKQDKKYVSLAPTNKAAIIINGITLHKFVSKLRNAKCLDKLNVDYIFVDEISMVKEIFYKCWLC